MSETTILDVYAAAGGKLSDDGLSVSIDSDMKPFDIVLRVIPTAVEYDNKEPTNVTFTILMDDNIVLDRGVVRHVVYNQTVTLPVNRVNIKE